MIDRVFSGVAACRFVLLLALSGLLLFAGGYFFFTRIVWVADHYAGIEDFAYLFDAALAYLNTGILYADTENMWRYDPGMAMYKYPPLYAAVQILLLKAGATMDAIRAIFAWLHVFCFYTAAAIGLASMARLQTPLMTLIVAVLVLCMSPLLEWNILFLQLDVYVLFLFALAMFFLSSERSAWCGVMIGFAAAIKVYPLVMALYFVFTRRWFVLAGIATGILLAAAISLSVISVAEHAVYLGTVLPYLLKELPALDNPYNVAFTALLMRQGVMPEQAGLLSQIGLLLVMTYFAWMHMRQRQLLSAQDIALSDLLSFAGCMAGMVFFMKNSWWNYQMLFVIPMVTILLLLPRFARVFWCVTPVLAVALVLLGTTTITQLQRNDWGDYSLYARGAGPALLLLLLLILRGLFARESTAGVKIFTVQAYLLMTILVLFSAGLSAGLGHHMHSEHAAWAVFRR